MTEYYLYKRVKPQFDALLSGIAFVIPLYSLRVFNEVDLALVIGGLSTINVNDWKSNTLYDGYSGSDQVIRWFWQFIDNSDQETRAKMLHFVTGSSAPPAAGFIALTPEFQIDRVERRVTAVVPPRRGFWGSLFSGARPTRHTANLPQAHTCFHRLDLPEYENYKELETALNIALEFGQGFGIA